VATPVELTIPIQHPCPWWYVGKDEQFEPKITPLAVIVEVSARDRHVYILGVDPVLRVWRGNRQVFKRTLILGVRRELNLPDAWVHLENDVVYCVDPDVTEREPADA